MNDTALVRDVMRREVHTTEPDETLEAALQRMLWSCIRHLPVVLHDGALAGVLSQRDILERMAMRSEAIALLHTSAVQLVRHAMRVPAVTVTQDETVGVAARLMAERKLG